MVITAHAIADALCDEYPSFAWLLRALAYQKFGHDRRSYEYAIERFQLRDREARCTTDRLALPFLGHR